MSVFWWQSKRVLKPTRHRDRRFQLTQHILLGFVFLLILGFAAQDESSAQDVTVEVTTLSPVASSTPSPSVLPVPSPSASPTIPPDLPERQRQGIEKRIDQYLAQMSAADKVGQLFVITFEGNDVGAESDIAELVYKYRVGGVVISPEHGNFTNARGADTPLDVATLTNQLQALSYGIALPAEDALDLNLFGQLAQADEFPTEWQLSEYITSTKKRLEDSSSGDNTQEEMTAVPLNLPLFIGAEQMGDNLPNTALRAGFTAIPSQMALGAAWNPELTKSVGEIVGRELSAVGVNMLLGPNLDVIDQSRPDAVGSLGIYSFGGSSYWVSRHGQAYISGVHRGSQNRVITIARHFPGQGDSDRLPTEEVATIQSSRAELERTDLPPFIDVTRNTSIVTNLLGNASTTDGLMTSHMRYSGIQGNVPDIGAIPLSLDTSLVEELNNELIGGWRNGGLVMSNELGSPAIRRYYESQRDDFPPRQIALDAFNAGHDLLYISQFSDDGMWESEKQNLIETITFFRERYDSNADFAAQVNRSVARILRVKLYLYTDMQATLTEAAAAQDAAETTPGSALEPAASQSLTETTGTTQTQEATDTLTSIIPLTDTEPANNSLDITTTIAAVDPMQIISDTVPISLTRAISVGQILISQEELASLTEGTEAAQAAETVVNQVTRDAVTLLYPTLENLVTAIPHAPQPGDTILIFTNSRLQGERECDQCISEVFIRPEAIEDIMNGLYGIKATGQISDAQITSKTFAELAELLAPLGAGTDSAEAIATSGAETGLSSNVNDESPEMESAKAPEDTPDASTGESDQSNEPENGNLSDLEQQIIDADWIIFAMLDINTAVDPYSDVLKRFLAQRADQIRDTPVFVFAFNAPYFLDATEVSRLSGYYGMYSKIDSSLESAVRALFRAFTPIGTAPVSIPGTRFSSLAEQLRPDPNRTPAMEFQVNGEVVPPPGEAEIPAELFALEEGQSLRIQVGPVLDYNGHQVPDNTPIQIQFDYADPVLDLPPVVVTTHNGIATYELLLDTPGELRVWATSSPIGENALDEATSAPTTFTVRRNPTDVLSEQATAIAFATPEAIATNAVPTEALPEVVDTPGGGQSEPQQRINVWTLMVALITIVVMSSLLVILQVRIMERTNLVRNLLWATIVGLFAYILYGVGIMPGATWLQTEAYPWGTSLIVFIAMLLPLLWLQLSTE